MVGKLVGACQDFDERVPVRGGIGRAEGVYPAMADKLGGLPRLQRRYLPVRGGAVQQDRQVEGGDLPGRDPQEPERRTGGFPRGERWPFSSDSVRKGSEFAPRRVLLWVARSIFAWSRGKRGPFWGEFCGAGRFLAPTSKRGLKPFAGKPLLYAWRARTPSVLGAGHVLGGR